MQIWKPILSVVIFFGVQGVGGVVSVLFNIFTGEKILHSNSDLISWTTLVTGIISVFLIALILKSIRLKKAFLASGANDVRNWGAGAIALIAAVAGIISINLLSEQVELPNWLESEFMDMSHSIIGIISVGIVGPIVEELVFRESIEGHLLRRGCKPWIAISVSALTFGIIHMNPAQIPFAALIGLILGILYWKTGNVWLCSILHIANNSYSLYEMRTLGPEAMNYRVTDEIGDIGTVWGIIAGCLIMCTALMWLFCKIYRPAIAKDSND